MTTRIIKSDGDFRFEVEHEDARPLYRVIWEPDGQSPSTVWSGITETMGQHQLEVWAMRDSHADLLTALKEITFKFREHLIDHAHEQDIEVEKLCPCWTDAITEAETAIAQAKK